ncbi:MULTISPECIES: MFS transporter [Pseudomonas]|jgi:MFS family permease|uniref:MFS transporter n=1 Tax=Pseudomonas psychrophila TaxID=122355 RepID=A0A8I1K3G9_9PSED|nr:MULTISPECIES: MFS transporter [Pseudomonas]EPJ95414.1 major facilitator transporter [Pseudomonas psychrophila]KAB0490838.1 MFS transporter [Pseudomonas psychrophila]MBJ2255374.1 MFS transporter [Pseudomonas psychrophila]MDY7581750.1 MFS transporter [Pseudomonas sp. CCI3.1]MEB0069096.1 MFS transporter [Pseudomonas sp. CCI3.1]
MRTIKSYKTLTIFFLFLIGVVNYLDRSALSIANTTIQKDLAISPMQMGVMLSAFSVAYAFSQLPLGALIDKLGSKLALGGSLVVWSVAQAAFGLFSSYGHLVGLRVLLGIGEAPVFPSAAKALSEWFDTQERGTATGWVWSSTCIGPCLAPPLLTVFMVHLGWRGMFILTGVMGLLLAVCWFKFYKSKAQYMAETGRAEPVPVQQAKAPKVRWTSLFKDRNTWGAFLGFMGVIYMIWLNLTWLPGYFEREHGLDLYRTAWVVSLAYLFGALGTIVAGKCCDRLVARGMRVLASRKLMVILGLLGGALFTLIVAFTTNVVACVILLCLTMFFINISSATAWMIVNTIVPSERVASFGSIQNFGGYLAGSIAPILTGFSVQQSGSFSSAFVISAVVAACSAFAYFALLKEPGGNASSPLQLREAQAL